MITVIGAGPAGCYTAHLLAQAGRDVTVYEEHNQVGKPVQCTGIVTSTLANIIKPKETFLVNTITKARIYSPLNDCVELTLKPNYILDRAKFDAHLSRMAEKSGAHIFRGHHFESQKNGHVTLKTESSTIQKPAEVLIGADGPQSAVAKSAGIYGNRKFFIGVQARARLKNDNAFEVYLGVGDFAWVVPESRRTVRIGLITRKSPAELFTPFLASRLGPDFQQQLIDYQAGLSPIYDPRCRTQRDSTYLVGDAATMVKATTAGGILQGLIAAEALADSIVNDKPYEHEWRRRIGKDLRFALTVRTMLDRCTDSDYNHLIRACRRPSMRRLLQEHDRDYLTSLLPQFAMEIFRQPGLLRFARFPLYPSVSKELLMALIHN